MLYIKFYVFIWLFEENEIGYKCNHKSKISISYSLVIEIDPFH